jgi:hypothetical protein
VEHLWFQNYKTLLLLIYQQLNNICRDCPKSRNAICCTLATIRFPRPPRGSNPAGGTADYEKEPPLGSESVGEISRPERKLILGGSASRTWCDSLVTSRKVTHATTGPGFGKWLVRAIQSLKRGMSHSGRVAISLRVSSSGGGLFKRPVILWMRALFIRGEVERSPSHQFQTITVYGTIVGMWGLLSGVV